VVIWKLYKNQLQKSSTLQIHKLSRSQVLFLNKGKIMKKLMFLLGFILLMTTSAFAYAYTITQITGGAQGICSTANFQIKYWYPATVYGYDWNFTHTAYIQTGSYSTYVCR
jgi:hypothetical protein